ncbi:branched-chain amino acid ABC transporter permease [Rhizobium sp. B230/85]|uniref:branched-chain amino acid ABC transporter permease n=1 Tax=unclassified Rhizobium TaxID=2613769 RepID=UPI001ADB33BA|nr:MULTISPECIES: branched-chain amino acid ABC transporter permease [unclassified Rhizobium]MBO9136466.1 branched-chain amino acid ABC transporter permease [Rhizobium sp. B209b/85]QXZ98665.1 branched-chain amino acid ABC transporter permease [Rhizobium sp. B230/85]
MNKPTTYGSWRREFLIAVACFAFLALLPLVVTEPYWRHVLIMVFIYAVAAASWDLTLGYGGIFNFGHLAFFGIGLYGYGVLTTAFGIWPWYAFALSGLIACAAAIVVTVPILRLKGIYIVLVTFGFSQLVMQIILSQSALTGGTQGIVRIPVLPIGDHNFIRDGKLGHYFMALGFLAVAVLALRVFIRSRSGTSLVALRDSEEYATSRGISVARQRMIALAFSALIAGLSGAFYGSYFRTASIEVFGMGFTSLVLSAILLGGAGSIYGPIVATFLLTVTSEFLTSAGAFRPMAIALIIIFVMLIYPGGLMGAYRSIAKRLGNRSADAPKATPR